MIIPYASPSFGTILLDLSEPTPEAVALAIASFDDFETVDEGTNGLLVAHDHAVRGHSSSNRVFNSVDHAENSFSTVAPSQFNKDFAKAIQGEERKINTADLVLLADHMFPPVGDDDDR